MIDATREGPLGRILTEPRIRLAQLLGRLEPREQRMVVGAAVITAAILVWLVVIDPLMGAIAGLDRSLTLARRQAASIADLAGRYSTLRAAVEGAEHGAAADHGGASLFARLEAITVPAVGREHITSMNPSSRQVGEKFLEESVELHLEGVAMRDLITLLYAIENSGRAMHLSRIAFKRQYKNPTQLDANLVVVRLRPQ